MRAITIELLAILLLILLNGIFAGAEIAVLSVRTTRVRELVEKGSRRARAVQALRDAPERFLATVQIWITVVGATAAAFGGSSRPESRSAPAFRCRRHETRIIGPSATKRAMKARNAVQHRGSRSSYPPCTRATSY